MVVGQKKRLPVRHYPAVIVKKKNYIVFPLSGQTFSQSILKSNGRLINNGNITLAKWNAICLFFQEMHNDQSVTVHNSI